MTPIPRPIYDTSPAPFQDIPNTSSSTPSSLGSGYEVGLIILVFIFLLGSSTLTIYLFRRRRLLMNRDILMLAPRKIRDPLLRRYMNHLEICNLKITRSDETTSDEQAIVYEILELTTPVPPPAHLHQAFRSPKHRCWHEAYTSVKASFRL